MSEPEITIDPVSITIYRRAVQRFTEYDYTLRDNVEPPADVPIVDYFARVGRNSVSKKLAVVRIDVRWTWDEHESRWFIRSLTAYGRPLKTNGRTALRGSTIDFLEGRSYEISATAPHFVREFAKSTKPEHGYDLEERVL